MYIKFLKQQNNWDCSIACVAMVSEYFHKNNLNYFQLLKDTKYYQDLNLLEIEELGIKLNVNLVSYFVNWKEFKTEKIKNPIICQTQNKFGYHFIVIFKKNNKKYLIANPTNEDVEWINENELEKIYTNIVLVSNPNKFSLNELLKEKLQLNFLQKITFPIICLLSISIFSTMLNILLQFLIKIIVDEILIKKINSQIFIIFFTFILLFLTNLIINIIFEKLKFKTEIIYKKKWNLLFFQRIKFLEYIDFKKYSIGLILEKYKYFNQIINFYFPNLINILHNLFFIIISTIILFFFNYWIVFLILIFTIVYLIIFIFIFPFFKNLNQKKIKNEEIFSINFINFLKNQNDLKRRNIDFNINEKIHKNFDEILKNNKKENSLQISVTSLINTIKFLIKILIIYAIIKLTSNKISIGFFLFLISITKSIIDKNLTFFSTYNEWIKIKKLKNILNPFLINKKEEITKIKLNKINKNEIKIENLNFEFTKNNLIWNKNKNILINQNTLINGRSGTGKTTLLQLIYGEIKTKTGTIKINNIDIKNKNIFKKEIIFLNSNSKLYDGSIIENILNFEINEIKLKKFNDLKLNLWLKKINLNLLNQIKNENLSNGQKQLIIFLSLFFTNSKIILLDECLNSLPSNFAKEILNYFIKNNKNKLILFSTHNNNLKNIFKNQINLNEH